MGERTSDPGSEDRPQENGEQQGRKDPGAWLTAEHRRPPTWPLLLQEGDTSPLSHWGHWHLLSVKTSESMGWLMGSFDYIWGNRLHMLGFFHWASSIRASRTAPPPPRWSVPWTVTQLDCTTRRPIWLEDRRLHRRLEGKGQGAPRPQRCLFTKVTSPKSGPLQVQLPARTMPCAQHKVVNHDR